jgi:DNA polymerase alpha-associated DNA helicase A
MERSPDSTDSADTAKEKAKSLPTSSVVHRWANRSLESVLALTLNQVVLATCHSAGSRQLNNVQFDVAIVDEATQAVEAVCWVPILKAKRLILAGDPQQVSWGNGLEDMV